MRVSGWRLLCPSIVFLVTSTTSATAGQGDVAGAGAVATRQSQQDYLLGPDDQIKIWALGFEEISEKPIRIDPSGFIDLPMLGRVKAGGLTLDELKSKLLERLAKDVRQPQASVEIVEFGSQPVSVMGAVVHPGLHQLGGHKTLVEILSLAGGLRPDAGPTVMITRRVEDGPIPLLSATEDSSGRFYTAKVKTADLLAAKNPGENIWVLPHDVITVPVAESISVIGAVRKPGAFVLNDRDGISALEALSMAEGLGPTPAPQDAKILRSSPGQAQRTEIPVDLRKVLAGHSADVRLQPNDILFVPSSVPKKAAVRAMEAAIQTATGIVIWRRP